MSTMPVGMVIADRFAIEAFAGRGGMGAVYRAADLHTQRPVALKLLRKKKAGADDAERFAREARMIADLRHPGIVAYVAHGETAEGQPFIAMEWLSGEDLGQRLDRGPLSIADSLTLLQRASEALAAAHRQGIVHRDLKPGNLFLRDGRVERTTLVDFGIAGRSLGAHRLTRTGVVLGTPEYMAPEQARGERAIEPSIDIFALGCVLYECLTGEPPFVAERVVAVLAKILFDAAPPVRDLRPEVPEPLSALIGRMLAKSAAERPASADALLAEVEALGELPARGDDSTIIAPAPARSTLADREQRLLSVVVAAPAGVAEGSTVVLDEDDSQASHARKTSLRAVLSIFRAPMMWLADGSLIVPLTGATSATDLVAKAARCALVIREHWPAARLALATGRGALQASSPVGEVVDRAARLAHARAAEERAASAAAEPEESILIDELTRDLLDARFVLAPAPYGARLLGELLHVDETRLLLGKPTPCVGRERELAFLESTQSLSADESVAQVVLVTAPPGVGKSRLRHEFVRRLAASASSPLLLIGRGDPVGRGALYGFLSQALRARCGVQSGDALAAQEAKLRVHLEERIASRDAPRVIEFLLEMCGIPSTAEPSAQLRAARGDPRIMSEQVTRAFVDWLHAECTRRPLLLVLEDLQWGDALTVNLVDAALREHRDQPLMVVAFARPEVKDLFPRLWEGRGLKEIALSGLSRKASERLVQQVLGEEVSAATMARIIAQAAGNALYLEEIVRTVAGGKRDELPETVLAMLQARLSCLSAGARLVLRFASVFGETFWRGGLLELLAPEVRAEELDAWLGTLVDAEVIEQRRQSRFPTETEYGFRHALVRDAAYSMLAEEDRASGHRRASLYLEQVGERDPMLLAEHANRGGDRDRAAPLYLQAAEQAYACDDWAAIQARAELGVATEPSGETLGSLRALASFAHYYRSEIRIAHRLASDAAPLLAPGSLNWCRAMAVLRVTAPNLGHLDQFAEVVASLAAAAPAEDARVTYLEAVAGLIIMFGCTGQRAPAEMFSARARTVSAPLLEHDATARGLLGWAEGSYALYLLPDPLRAVTLTESCVLAYLGVGHNRNLAFAQLFLGLAQAALGERERGEETLRQGLEGASRRQELMPQLTIKVNWASLLVRPDGSAEPGRREEARRLTTEVLEAGDTVPALIGQAHGFLARVLLGAGEIGQAEAELREALSLLGPVPALQPLHLATGIHIRLRQERLAEAAELAREGIALIESLGGTGYSEVELRLAAVLGLRAAGAVTEAEHALREACRQIEIRAATIPEGPARERFLERVPENAAVLALARGASGAQLVG